MEEAILSEKLIQFGLGRQEANVYLCLLKNGELNGYEVSKLTGISRSNVYNSLALLVEHGAAMANEGESVKYSPVDVEEFCSSRIRELMKFKEELVREVPRPKEPTEGYLSIEGCRNIESRVRTMLDNASQRIYLAAGSYFVARMAEELKGCVDRNLKVVIISDSYPEVISDLRDRIIFYNTLPSDSVYMEDWKPIRLVTDSKSAFTGEVDEAQTYGSGIYSSQKNFVRVLKDALSNEIKLITGNTAN